MKKILLSFLAIILLASCGQQKFAFRKTVPVDIVKEEVVKNGTPKTGLIVPKSNALTQQKSITERELLPLEMQVAEASAEKATPQTVAPEWKQKTPQPTTKSSPQSPLKKMEGGNGMAIAGFILAILGWFIAGIILCTLGVIFSAIGLKSDRKGLAIAGLIIGILGVVFSIIAISAAINAA
jgi:hypothetical protein